MSFIKKECLMSPASQPFARNIICAGGRSQKALEGRRAGCKDDMRAGGQQEGKRRARGGRARGGQEQDGQEQDGQEGQEGSNYS